MGAANIDKFDLCLFLDEFLDAFYLLLFPEIKL